MRRSCMAAKGPVALMFLTSDKTKCNGSDSKYAKSATLYCRCFANAMQRKQNIGACYSITEDKTVGGKNTKMKVAENVANNLEVHNLTFGHVQGFQTLESH